MDYFLVYSNNFDCNCDCKLMYNLLSIQTGERAVQYAEFPQGCDSAPMEAATNSALSSSPIPESTAPRRSTLLGNENPGSIIPLGISADSRHLDQPLPSSSFMKVTNDMFDVSGLTETTLPTYLLFMALRKRLWNFLIWKGRDIDVFIPQCLRRVFSNGF